MDCAPTPRLSTGSPDINAGFAKASELFRSGVPIDQASALGASYGWSSGTPPIKPNSGSI